VSKYLLILLVCIGEIVFAYYLIIWKTIPLQYSILIIVNALVIGIWIVMRMLDNTQR
jgi:hypothetical protein